MLRSYYIRSAVSMKPMRISSLILLPTCTRSLVRLLPFQRHVHPWSSFRNSSTRRHLSSTSSSSTSFSSTTEDDDDRRESYSKNEFATEYHAPVMWKECIAALIQEASSLDDHSDRDASPSANRNRIFVDGTLGGGGHSAALLQRLDPGDIVYGCDVDPQALETATARLSEYAVRSSDGTTGSPTRPLFVPIACNFGRLHQSPVLSHLLGKVDGILLDLGVSSHQIDNAERGFTFQGDGPLDMRMDPMSLPLSAADLCNELDVKELARILKRYADEPRARRIAQSIVDHRPLTMTSDLQNAVAAVTPAFCKQSRRQGRTATLARVFQALRIVVNQEDAMLEQALTVMAPKLLRPGGRLVVLSYHSLEDRATKRVMRDGTVQKSTFYQEKDVYGNHVVLRPFRPLGKARKPLPEEVETNPRARSAVLRVAEKS